MGIPYLPKDSGNLDGKNKRRGVLFDPSSHPSRLLLDLEPSAEFSACLYDKIHLIRPLSISKFSSGETGLPFQKFHLFRKVCIIYINRNFPIVLLTEKRPIKTAIMSVLKWLVLGLN